MRICVMYYGQKGLCFILFLTFESPIVDVHKSGDSKVDYGHTSGDSKVDYVHKSGDSNVDYGHKYGNSKVDFFFKSI